MSTERLQSLKHITTWSGAGANLCGIILSYATGGSLAAFGLALFGLLIICCGHWVAHTLAKRQEIEHAADKKKITRRIDRIKYGAGGALGYDIEDVID
jgi:hypothetical protein